MNKSLLLKKSLVQQLSRCKANTSASASPTLIRNYYASIGIQKSSDGSEVTLGVIRKQWNHHDTPAVHDLISTIHKPYDGTHRRFYSSTTIASNQESTKEAVTSSSSSSPTITIQEKKPSVLAEIPPENLRPGLAWNLIHTHYAGGKLIRSDDFKLLCGSSRGGVTKDSKIILRALFSSREHNSFIVDRECAQSALEGMVKSMCLRETKEDNDNGNNHLVGSYSEGEIAEQKLKTAIWLVEEVLSEKKTGLSTAVETSVLEDTILRILLEGALGVDSPLATESSEDDDEEVTVEKVVSSTKKVFELLIDRASNPTKSMKKRAKRKYLRELRCCEGPSPKTLDLAVRICISANNKDSSSATEVGIETAKKLLQLYADKPFLGSAMEGTVTLVEDAEEKRLQLLKDMEQTAEEEENDDDENADEDEDKSK